MNGEMTITRSKEAHIRGLVRETEERIKAVSILENGRWHSVVTSGQSYNLPGLIQFGFYGEGRLSLSVNDGRRHLVYCFTADRAGTVNLVSDRLEPWQDIALFLNPNKGHRIYVRHRYIDKLYPIIGDIEADAGGFSFSMGSSFETVTIHGECGESMEETEVYRAYSVRGSWREDLLETRDLSTGLPVSRSRLSSGRRIYT